MMYLIKAILFDMDGVLIDSNIEIEQFWKDWTLKEGLLLSDEDIIQRIHGRTTLDTIHELFQHSNDFTKKQILKAALDFDLNMRPALIKGAGSFLEDLRLSFDKIAIVTSAPITRAKKMLELHNIYRFFACSVTGDEVKKGKPDPEPYLRAAVKLNVPPNECLVFEDSNSGIVSALAAGMHVITVNNDKYQDLRIVANISNYTDLFVNNELIGVKNHFIQIKLLSE